MKRYMTSFGRRVPTLAAVLLAGKGHEKSQILRDRTIPFDDVAVAQKILEKLR